MPNLMPLTASQRCALFGRFAYKPDPSKDNPERIMVTDTWAKDNLVCEDLPSELLALPGADQAVFHKLVWPKFLELVDAWRCADVLQDVQTWGGSYAKRFIRGRVGSLSSHAWGSALDLNVQWNGLGVHPPAIGKPGSVRRLVPIANELGWAWGGHFSRPDGMHLELTRL